ncbi:GIY-YIG nuclease family protein [Streptomyces sp. NPDC092046]|uniref:GIY-YIG nuclease family protein n=1 Tax=Streptomyces sp. NPDC092046 TaxID=3366009 RepID=UPI0037FDB2CD
MAKLVATVDQSDPAFIFIAMVLHRMRRTGTELNPEVIEQAIAEGRQLHARHLKEEATRNPARIPRSIVYYIRRGPLVKIGTTTRAMVRFRELLPDEILAWEPGGREEEAQRHQQFRDLQVRRGAEYFRRDERLDYHIADLRETHGEPHPRWPTLSGLPQQKRRTRLPDLPDMPLLGTLEEGARQLGIRLGTARVWIHRGKLQHFIVQSDGVKLYFLSDLRSLAAKGRRRPTGS